MMIYPTKEVNISNKISDRDLIYEAKLTGKIPELMRGILRRQIIEREVQAAGISPSVAELQAAADRFRLVNQLESAEATQKWLDERLLALDDFEDLITQNLLADRLAKHLFGDRVEQIFYQNLIDYTGAIIYEVMLEDDDVAMEIYYSLQEGDLNFSDVAQQYIPVPNSADAAAISVKSAANNSVPNYQPPSLQPSHHNYSNRLSLLSASI